MSEKTKQDTVRDVDIETSLESSTFDPTFINQVSERKLVWKQDLRIIPLTAGIYLLCYLDRSNIGT